MVFCLVFQSFCEWIKNDLIYCGFFFPQLITMGSCQWVKVAHEVPQQLASDVILIKWTSVM